VLTANQKKAALTASAFPNTAISDSNADETEEEMLVMRVRASKMTGGV